MVSMHLDARQDRLLGLQMPGINTRLQPAIQQSILGITSHAFRPCEREFRAGCYRGAETFPDQLPNLLLCDRNIIHSDIMLR